MDALTFNEKKKYSESSGSCTIVNENISIKLNDFGIYEEYIDTENLALEELDPAVELVSPSLNQELSESDIANELYAEIKEIKFDERLGYYQALYAGHVAEDDYRKNASSGGMGTWIFKELFEKKLIDGVIHVKRNSDNVSSTLFKYEISRSLSEINEGAKTKYYPVEISEVIKLVKEIPGKYAIIGIPSFIMAIRLLAKNDKVIKDRIKYTVGLICGHQKSSKFAESLAWQVGIKPGDLKYIDFRKKLLDKPASNYGVEMTGTIEGNEVTIIKPIKELYGQNWGYGFFKTNASDFTDDVMNETADITLGDAWLPEYTKDSKGNNVVVVRNTEINKLIREGIKSGRLNLDEVNRETVFDSQAAHYRHTRDELSYRLYKKDIAEEWRPKKRVASSKQIPLLRRKVQDLREEISIQSHIAYKRAVELDDFNYFKNHMKKLTKKYNLIYKVIKIKKLGLNGLKNKIINKIF